MPAMRQERARPYTVIMQERRFSGRAATCMYAGQADLCCQWGRPHSTLWYITLTRRCSPYYS
eukprot:scaffold12689_cov60-Phaeocystis_antarctica.AAC.1